MLYIYLIGKGNHADPNLKPQTGKIMTAPRARKASTVKTLTVDPSIASAVAAAPADLWADLQTETKARQAEAKARRSRSKAAPFVKLTASQVEALKAVGWAVPRQGQESEIKHKVVQRLNETGMSAFYDRVTNALKKGSLELSFIAVGYAKAVKCVTEDGQEPKFYLPSVALKGVANRLGRSVFISENRVYI